MTTHPTIVVIQVNAVRDPAAIAAYTSAIGPTLARHGGQTIAQGLETFEGETRAKLVVVQAWPSSEAFKAWQADPDYAPLLSMRQAAADITVLIVPPVAPQPAAQA